MDELETLLEEAQHADLEAYGEIVRRFQDMAVGYAYAVLGDFHAAEDAAQEAFIEAYENLARVYDPTAFPSWLRRIVYKHCDRFTRGRRPATVAPDLLAETRSAAPDPSEVLEARELRDRVLAAIRSLPEHERTVTTLYYMDGLSQSQIGQFLEIPEKTVKSRLHSARRRLRERMVDMVEKHLHDERPSRDEDFADTVIQLLSENRARALESLLMSMALAKEPPQTIALVLLGLREAKAGDIFARLSPEVQGEVGFHLATFRNVTRKELRTIEQRMPEELRRILASEVIVGSPRQVAGILNRAGQDTERAVLERLDRADPELGEQVRVSMFTFADIAVLSDQAIATIVRQADLSELAVAMKGAEDEMIKRVFANASPEIRKGLEQEMRSHLVRVDDIEEAQLEMVRTVRQLEKAGKITVVNRDRDPN